MSRTKGLILFAGMMLIPMILMVVMHLTTTQYIRSLPYFGEPTGEIVEHKTRDADTLVKPVPAFELETEEGKPISDKNLIGKITLADFYYSPCDTVCVKNKIIRKIKTDFAEIEDLQFLSFMLNDSSLNRTLLEQNREVFGMEGDKWMIASGNNQEILTLRHYFEQATVGKLKPGTKAGLYLTLIDGQGRIRGFYYPDDMKVLDEELRVLMVEHYGGKVD